MTEGTVLDLDDCIKGFLAADRAGAMCISGKWGTGKTHTWLRVVKESASSNLIRLPMYSYVSMFGVGSISELKTSIFENAIKVSDIGNDEKAADFTTLLDRISGLGRKRATIIAKTIQFLPGVKGDFSLFPSLFMDVRKYLVCIDDIERRSTAMPLVDVLGLVSFLSEERNCKVIVLLNDGELTEGDTSVLRKYSEKVFDSFIKYEPTSLEAVRAASVTSQYGLSEHCETLGILNIRVLRKINSAFDEVIKLINMKSDELKRQAAVSVALLGWSVHEPELAPNLTYVLDERVRSMFGVGKDEPVSKDAALWNPLLDQVGFVNADDFDRVLADGMQKGYFDKEKVMECANASDQRFNDLRSSSAIHDVWNFYHSSFDDNKDEVIAAIYQAYKDNIKYVNINDLDAFVSLLREFNEDQKASEVIQQFVECRKNNPSALEISGFPFLVEIKDSEILDSLEKAKALAKIKPDVKTSILALFAPRGGIRGENIEFLSTLSIEDYRQVFKTSRGEELKTAMASCLEFDRIGNASIEMRTISAKAKEALKLIGNENEFNARRVRGNGVQLDTIYYPFPAQTPYAK